MIKKIIFVLACLFIFALNYNNESLAYTDEDQNIDISFVVPAGMFNNMLYSSVDDNSIYWVIDSQTFFASDYFYPYDFTSGWIQPIETALSGGFYYYLDVAHNYIIFDLKAWQTAYMGTWTDSIKVAIFPNNINLIDIINTNGVCYPYVTNGVYKKNLLTIESLINNLNLLNLTLQLNNETYFENGFDSGSAFGYGMGYQEGYDIGVIDGTTDGQLQIWQNGYDKGVIDGTKLGESTGFATGFIEGVSAAYEGGFEGFSYSELSLLTDDTSYPYYLGLYAADDVIWDDAYAAGRLYERQNPVMFAWIMGLFSAMGVFLGIEILPNITIGLIVSIPLLFGLVMFFVKLFRGS